MKRQLMCSAASAMLLAVGPAFGDDFEFSAQLSGAQEVVFMDEEFVPGGVETDGSALAAARFDQGLSSVSIALRVLSLTGTFAAAHFHCGHAGENGPIVFGFVEPGRLTFDGELISGDLTNADYTGADCVPVVGRPINNIASLALAMKDGLIYVNVHTDLNPGGEIRGQMLDDDAFDDDDDDSVDDVLEGD